MDISLSVETVERLIASQFPDLQQRKVRAAPSLGTDNLIFRLGDDLCARFPKVTWAIHTAKREAAVLPYFQAAPISVPELIGMGEPTELYPHYWSILSWLPGNTLGTSKLKDAHEGARRLASFVKYIRSRPVDNTLTFSDDNNNRGAPLQTRASAFEKALQAIPHINTNFARRLWDQALNAAPGKDRTWLHGDIHPENLLVHDGRFSGAIDWGLCGVGDGACDLLSAWAIFDWPARETYRQAIDANNDEWLRGAGWALSMAVIYLPHAYENGLRTDMSERMLKRLEEEFA